MAEEQISKFVKGFGKVLRIQLHVKPAFVYAFITFSRRQDGELAVSSLDSCLFLERVLEETAKSPKLSLGSKLNNST